MVIVIYPRSVKKVIKDRITTAVIGTMSQNQVADDKADSMLFS
jgi:hypothetical protein